MDWHDPKKVALFVSIIVVALISILTYLLMFLKIRKIKKQIQNEEIHRAHAAILAIRGEPIGELPQDIKEYLKCKIDNLDLEQFINTTYLNKVEDILLDGSELEYPLFVLNKYGNGNIKVLKSSLDVKKWNDAVLTYPKDFEKQPNFVKDINEQKYSLVYIINSKLNNQEIYKKYYPLVANVGMLVVLINQGKEDKKKDLKALVKELKSLDIRHEVSYVKGQFLYIVKNNEINDKKIEEVDKINNN